MKGSVLFSVQVIRQHPSLEISREETVLDDGRSSLHGSNHRDRMDGVKNISMRGNFTNGMNVLM